MPCSAARALVLAGALALPRTNLAAEVEAAPAASEPEPAFQQGLLGPVAPGADAEAASAGRGLALGLSAGVARSPGERERVFGLLELSVGLDGWVTPGVATSEEPDPWGSPSPGATAPPISHTVAEPDPWPRAPLAHAPPGSLAAPAPTVAGARVGADPLAPAGERRPARRAGLAPAAARLARAVVAEALRVGGSSAELRRLDQMASRSRAAASLPEVRLGAGTARDESQRLSPTVSDPARFTHDGGRDLWLEARLTWRLDSAIFARDEVAIMRLRAQQREESERLVREVLEALVDWHRSRLVLASAFALPEERDAASVRQFGAVVRLDVLTDGWFSRYLERVGGDAGTAPWP